MFFSTNKLHLHTIKVTPTVSTPLDHIVCAYVRVCLRARLPSLHSPHNLRATSNRHVLQQLAPNVRLKPIALHCFQNVLL